MRVEEFLFRQLSALGVTHAFGLPGSQNIGFFDAVQDSDVELFTPSHELAAGFAAVGYGRVKARPAVVLAIPGPGLSYTIPALAEAMHDSVPLLLVTQSSFVEDGPPGQLQQLDDIALLRPVVKSIVRVRDPDSLKCSVRDAYESATSNPDGPVVLLFDKGLGSREVRELPGAERAESTEETPKSLAQLAKSISAADRVLFFVSHAVDDVAAELMRLSELSGAAVITTPGARGVIPEDHAHHIASDQRNCDALNQAISTYDLIVSFGIRYSHSNTFGFKLTLPEGRVVNIGTQYAAPGGAYGGQQIDCDPGTAVKVLLHRIESARNDGRRNVKVGEIPLKASVEPEIAAAPGMQMATFFDELGATLARKGTIVTDSGSHQFHARRHFSVGRPAGLVTPAEFQSMGFGLPAAMGAKLADPDAPVVVIVGDGGLLMTGMELATLARYQLGIPVIVFCDRHYGLIRNQQMAQFGRAVGADVHPIDLHRLAQSFDAEYARFDGNIGRLVTAALERSVPTIIEVEIHDSVEMTKRARKARAKRTIRRFLSAGLKR